MTQDNGTQETALAVYEWMELKPEAVDRLKESLKKVEAFAESLEEGIDYGTLPGTREPCLWDPGASKIINLFQCYPEPEILRAVETEELVSFTIRVKLINRFTKEVVGEGVGACSTWETKYKYRWVTDPTEYGYEDTSGLKVKEEHGKVLYRIPNPEYGELVNTILKMATKRAEVDAAEGLPGVGSALRKKFNRPARRSNPMNWTQFWTKVRSMGFSGEQVHEILNIGSIKDWVEEGHTLEEALDILAKQPGRLL